MSSSSQGPNYSSASQPALVPSYSIPISYHLSSRTPSYHCSPRSKTNALENDIRTRITDAGILHILTLTTVLVPDKLKSHPVLLVPPPTPQSIPFNSAQCTEEDANRVPSTDRVLRPAQVTRKRGMGVCRGRLLTGHRIGARATCIGRGRARAGQRGEREGVHCFVVQCGNGLVNGE